MTVTYTPWMAETAGGIADAFMAREERGLERQKNEVASRAWMGDPEAMNELASLDAELAREIEDQRLQRETTNRQNRMAIDKTFNEDFQQFITEVARFKNFESAKPYADRRLAMLAEKYPERLQQMMQGQQFDEEAFAEAKTVASAAAGRPGTVGSPGYYRTTKDVPGIPKGTILRGVYREDGTEDVTNPLTNAPMTIEERNAAGVFATGSLDATQAGAIAGEKVRGEAGAEIEVAEELSEAEKRAEARANAIVNLPKQVEQATQTIGAINGIRNDPALQSVTAEMWLNPAKILPGTEAFGFMQRVKQLEGKVFAQAYETLKGGGPITEIESDMAMRAIARMSTAQSTEDYLAALQEFEDAVRSGVARVEREARGDFSYEPLPPAGTTPPTETPQQRQGKTQEDPVDATTLTGPPPAGTWVRLPDGRVVQTKKQAS